MTTLTQAPANREVKPVCIAAKAVKVIQLHDQSRPCRAQAIERAAMAAESSRQPATVLARQAGDQTVTS